MKSKELESATIIFYRLKNEKDAYERMEKETVRLMAQFDTVEKELHGPDMVDDTAYQGMKDQLTGLVDGRSKILLAARSCDERISAVSKELGSMDAKFKAASEAKKCLDSSKNEISVILNGLTAARLQELQNSAEQTLLALESERKSIEHEVIELEALIPRLSPGLSECPLCSSKLTEDGILHVKEEKAASIALKKKRLIEINAVIPARKKENDSILARIRKHSLIFEQIAGLENELKGASELQPLRSALESEAMKLKEERLALQKRLDSVSEAAEKIRIRIISAERLRARGKELLEIESRLKEAKEKLSSIHFDPVIFEDSRLSAERLRLESERIISEKRAIESQLKVSKEMLQLLRSELSMLSSLGKEMAELASLEEQLSVFKNALLETQTNLRVSLTDAINSAMNEVWPIFYPYRNYPSLRLAVSEKDYIFEVNDRGEWKALETLASGGERACAALTMRVALAMVLTPKLSWLILDEPTHNLDSAAVGLLSSALEQKVPEVVRQTFVITHDEAFMGSEFASSYRLMRDKERDGETKVENI
jgi:DNA repair exonuclease SbcCD ATPase subunit